RLSETPEMRRHGFVFQRNGVRMRQDGWLRGQFVKAVQQAGLTDFHFHDLRHTWASQAAMRGADVQSIARVLGHKTLRMTQRYSPLSDAHLKASMETAAPRMPESTATKLLQSDRSMPHSAEAAGDKKAESPRFLAGILDGDLVDRMGLEPTAFSMP